MNTTTYQGNVRQVRNVWFVSDVVQALVKRYHQNGLESLSAPERVVFLTWCIHGEIGNGGLRYFYEGNLPVPEVAEGFEQLGFTEAAEALRRSSTFFPPEVVAKAKTLEWLEHLWEEADEEEAEELYERVSDFFRPFENVIWELEPSEGELRLSARLVEYIRTHASEFGLSPDSFPDPSVDFSPEPQPVPLKPRRWPTRAAMS